MTAPEPVSTQAQPRYQARHLPGTTDYRAWLVWDMATETPLCEVPSPQEAAEYRAAALSAAIFAGDAFKLWWLLANPVLGQFQTFGNTGPSYRDCHAEGYARLGWQAAMKSLKENT